MGTQSPAIEDTCGRGGFALLALSEAGANVFEDCLPIPALCPNKWQGLGVAAQHMAVLGLHLNKHVNKSGLGCRHCLNQFNDPL